MKKKIIFFLSSLILVSTTILGEDRLTIEKLEQLKAKNYITNEDYAFLKAELEGRLKEDYSYSLFIDRKLITNNLKILTRNNKNYISLDDYFKLIYFSNYQFKNSILTMYLGDSLEKVEIDFENFTVIQDNRTAKFKQSDFYIEENRYYISINLFKNIFTSTFHIDNNKQLLSLTSKYNLPDKINNRLEESKSLLEKKKNIDKIYYTNKHQLINLGYLQVDLNRYFSRFSKKKNSDWNSKLIYQSDLIYGTFTGNYDLKNRKLDLLKLRYDNLPYSHFLEFKGEKTFNNNWIKSISIDKKLGYYDNGKNFIIKENVPIGSRVELIYLGTTIDIQDAVNGIVVFDNKELRDNREYTLRIHNPNGTIKIKTIETADNFNQQNRDEFQYQLDISQLEDSYDKKRSEFSSKIFYGITDFLTIGGSYSKSPKLLANKDNNRDLKYLEFGGIELIYTNTLDFIIYTIDLNSEKILNKNIYGKSNSFFGKAQIKISDLTFEYEKANYSEYYSDKNLDTLSLNYQPFSFLTLNQSYEWRESWKGERYSGYNLDMEISKSFGRVLTTFEYERADNREDVYLANLYYSLPNNYGIRWNNSITERERNLKSKIALYNIRGNTGVNYSIEFSYDKKEREKLTFKFNIELDNLFKIDVNTKDNGNYNISLGFNRIMDLKDIKKPIDSIDSSRAKVRSFLDLNGNNRYDVGESFVGNVQIEINGKKKVTNSKKPIYFYNIPNDILYELKPIIKFPGYDLYNTKLYLKGTGSGDILVDIPIKPFFSISGQLQLDEKMLSEIVITLKDSKGKLITNTLPDYLGYYDISQLSQGEYTLEIRSFKNPSITPLIKKIEVKYKKGNGNTIILNGTIHKNKIVERN